MNASWESVVDFTVFLALMRGSQLLALVAVRYVPLRSRQLYLPLFAVFYTGAALLCLKVFLLSGKRDWKYLGLVTDDFTGNAWVGCVVGLGIVPLFAGM